MDSYIYTTPSDRIYFQGRRDGIDIGEDRGRRETASRMLADGMPEDKVIKYSGLSKEEVEKLK